MSEERSKPPEGDDVMGWVAERARKESARLGKGRQRLIAHYRGKIREQAIKKAKVQILLRGRKVEDFSEDELEVIVADEEAKIRERLKLAPLTAVAFLLGISAGTRSG